MFQALGISIDGVIVENFRFTAVMPEPATLTLLGLGAASLGTLRRRRNT